MLRQLLTVLFPRPWILSSFTRYFFTKGYIPDESAQLLLDLFRIRLVTIRFSNIPKPDQYTVEEFRHVEVPTLFLVGEHEVFYSPTKAIKWAQRVITQIRTGVISNAGHGLMLEMPKIVNEHILEFLS